MQAENQGWSGFFKQIETYLDKAACPQKSLNGIQTLTEFKDPNELDQELQKFWQTKPKFMADKLNLKYCQSVADLELNERLQRNTIKKAREILARYKKESGGKDYPPLGLVSLKNQLAKSYTNTVIVISGFMSKDSDKDEEWVQFTRYFETFGLHANTYALNWDANNPTELYKNKGKEALENIIGSAANALMAAKSGASKMSLAAAGYSAFKQISNTVSQTKGVFLEAKKQAKYAGKLLGCSIALSYPFETQAINIIGFSLGCQVTKSCLKTLH